MLKRLLLLGALTVAVVSSPCVARAATTSSAVDEASAPQPAAESQDPFDHHVAISGYALGWAGGYPAAGVGGRLRGEWPHVVGVEGFADHLAVEWPGGFRHDHPIGFDVYKPFQLGSRVRILPKLGACVVFSFIEPEHAGGPRADDILFGVHGGAALEVALHKYWSFFVEAQGIAYFAHDRSSQNWTGSVSQSVSTTGVFQPSTGLQVHFL